MDDHTACTAHALDNLFSVDATVTPMDGSLPTLLILLDDQMLLTPGIISLLPRDSLSLLQYANENIRGRLFRTDFAIAQQTYKM